MANYFYGDELTAKAGVLLMHGITGAPSDVRLLAEYLAGQGFFIYTPLLSGHESTLEDFKKTRTAEWLRDVEDAFSLLKSKTKKPLFVAGLSFGAILSLHLCTCHQDEIKGVILLSPPWELRSGLKEIGLTLLSACPTFLLNLLPVVKKAERLPDVFVQARGGYDVHSVAAIVRLRKIREDVERKIKKLQLSILILFDPEDHHVAPESIHELTHSLEGEDIVVMSFPGGQHELTIGKRYQEVNETIGRWLEAHL